MDAFICILWVTATFAVTFDMQNEDAVVIAGKSLSNRQGPIVCINQFDGKVLWFVNGKQVER